MVVADLNGDGRPDIAFYGDGEGPGGALQSRAPTAGAIRSAGTLRTARWTRTRWPTGDLNGDGRTDLVLLGDNGSLYFLAAERRTTRWASRRKFPIPARPRPCRSWTWTATARNDLLLVDWDSPTPFRFRLQNAGGQLGPEIYFKTPPIRSYCADNLEATPRTYVVTIAQNSGRAEVSQFTRKPAEALSGAFQRGQFQILPLNKTDAAQRGVLWADVNGDGRPDLLVAEPESGQLSVYLQQPDGSLAPPKTFPTPGRREPDRGGGLERRRQAGDFPFEPGRKRGRRDAVRQKRPAAVSDAAFRSTASRW